MLKSIIYIVVVNQERLISAVPHLYYHRRLFYRLYFTVSLDPYLKKIEASFNTKYQSLR